MVRGSRKRRAGAFVLVCAIAGGAWSLWTPTGSRGGSYAPTITLARVSGLVYVRGPDEASFAELTGKQTVPPGTEVEATQGKVSLTASTGQHGDFYDGRFVILAPASQAAALELDLSGTSFKSCRKSGRFTLAKPPVRRIRRLWGNAKGRFLTRGRYSITAVRGTVWLTQDTCAGTLARVARGRVTVADLLQERNVKLPAGKSYLSKAPVEFAVPTEAASPTSIVTGPDGNLWFTESVAGRVGRSTPHGSIIEFSVPVGGSSEGAEPSSSPQVIVSGPDKNLWFTDSSADSIDRITVGGRITRFPVAGSPTGLTSGPQGSLWFTEDDSTIGRISTEGSIQYFSVPLENPGDATRIAAGADGNLWITETGANKIGRLTPQGAFTDFDVPTEDSGPTGIAAGPDGNVWFTELASGKVGRISPTGSIVEFALPAGEGSTPDEITTGPDGNIWVTENGANQLARITRSGRITEVPVPSDDAGPVGITTGPGRTIWFTEETGNNIACARC